MPKNHDIVTIEVTLKHQTQETLLVDVGHGGVWVPKSLCPIAVLVHSGGRADEDYAFSLLARFLGIGHTMPLRVFN